MPVTTLWPLADRLGLQPAPATSSRRSPAPMSRASICGISTASSPASMKVRATSCGERLGPLVGPDEVVADGGGDGVLQLGADLGPVLGRVAAVDHLLGVLGDRAEAAAQIVVDVGGQVGDAVVEHLLPQRGLLQRVLGLLLAPLQVGGQPRRGSSGSLIADSSVSTASVRCSAAERTSASTWSRIRSFSRDEHLLAEELDDRREVRLLVEFLVVHLRWRGCAAPTRPG